MELAFKALREFAALVLEHDFINGCASRLSLIALVTIGDLTKHLIVARAVKSHDQTVEVVDHVEAGRVVGVEVSDLAHVFLALVLTLSSLHTIAEGVADDLDGLQIAFEFEEVIHDLSAQALQLRLGELVELGDPNLAHAQLNLLERVVGHSLRNELGVDLGAFVGLRGSSHFVEELAEVGADRQIDEHVLVKRGIVVTLDWLDVLQFGEAAKRV